MLLTLQDGHRKGDPMFFHDCDRETTICQTTPRLKTPFKCECLNDAYETGSVKTCKRSGEFLKVKTGFDLFYNFFEFALIAKKQRFCYK